MFFDLELALAALPELGERTRAALERLLPGRGDGAAAQPGAALPAGVRRRSGDARAAGPGRARRSAGVALAGAAVERQPRRRPRRAAARRRARGDPPRRRPGDRRRRAAGHAVDGGRPAALRGRRASGGSCARAPCPRQAVARGARVAVSLRPGDLRGHDPHRRSPSTTEFQDGGRRGERVGRLAPARAGDGDGGDRPAAAGTPSRGRARGRRRECVDAGRRPRGAAGRARVAARRARSRSRCPRARSTWWRARCASTTWTGPQKRDLFARVREVLAPGGRFVLGDVVVPGRPGAMRRRLCLTAMTIPSPLRRAARSGWRETGFDARVVWEHRRPGRGRPPCRRLRR